MDSTNFKPLSYIHVNGNEQQSFNSNNTIVMKHSSLLIINLMCDSFFHEPNVCNGFPFTVTTPVDLKTNDLQFIVNLLASCIIIRIDPWFLILCKWK